MTIVLVSTVRRRTPDMEPSGYLYTVDLENQRTLLQSPFIEPPLRTLDKNPRGGMRGAKGIAVSDEEIILANYSMIFRYDPQWRLLGVISHPVCADIHDILLKDKVLWVTSARTDSLLQFDLSGNLLSYYYLRTPSSGIKALGWRPDVLLDSDGIYNGKIDFRDPRTHEKETFDRAHVNGICVLSDGSLLVSLGFVFGTKYAAWIRMKIRLIHLGVWPALLAVNRKIRGMLGLKRDMHSDLVVKPADGKSAILRITPQGERTLCLALTNVAVPSHSLLLMPDETAVYLNTMEGTILHFDPQTCNILSSTWVTDGFLRGITQLPDGKLLLGSRGELITFDLDSRQVVSRISISENPNEAVYDLKALPSHYSLPPASFAEHFEKAVGYRAAEMPEKGYPPWWKT